MLQSIVHVNLYNISSQNSFVSSSNANISYNLMKVLMELTVLKKIGTYLKDKTC